MESSSFSPLVATYVTASFSPGTMSAAVSMSWRTGVMPSVPMMSEAVISAPTQWEMSMTSWTEQPGKKYLLPPEKPTTSCGKTGPTTRLTSASATILLIWTAMARSANSPWVRREISSAGTVPSVAMASGLCQS